MQNNIQIQIQQRHDARWFQARCRLAIYSYHSQITGMWLRQQSARDVRGSKPASLHSSRTQKLWWKLKRLICVLLIESYTLKRVICRLIIFYPKRKSLRLLVSLAALKRLDCFLFFFDCKRRIEPFFQKNVSGNQNNTLTATTPSHFLFSTLHFINGTERDLSSDQKTNGN